MTLDDLTDIIQACSRHDDLTPIRVAATFGNCAFLRISNLAPPTAQEFDRTRHTTFSDVLPQIQGLVINLKWTKSRQRTRNAISIPLPTLGETDLCPLKAWLIYNRVLQLKMCGSDTGFSATDIHRRGCWQATHHPCSSAPFQQGPLRGTPGACRLHPAQSPTRRRYGGLSCRCPHRCHQTPRDMEIFGGGRLPFSQPLFQTPVATTFAKLLQDYQRLHPNPSQSISCTAINLCMEHSSQSFINRTQSLLCNIR